MDLARAANVSVTVLAASTAENSKTPIAPSGPVLQKVGGATEILKTTDL